MSVQSKPEKTEKKVVEHIGVDLKPFIGLSPRFYVPTIWGLLVFGTIFFLLILPGINKNGTWLTIYTDPPGASIVSDGIRLGRSYTPVFVEKGHREIVIRRVGFEPKTIPYTIRGRIFASQIFPRRETMEVRLSPLPEYNPWTHALQSFAGWSGTGNSHTRYAIPPVLTSAARDSNAGGMHTTDVPTMVDSVAPMLRDSRHVADLMRSAYILSSTDAVANPASLANFIHSMAQLRTETLLGVAAISGTEEMDLSIESTPSEDALTEELLNTAYNQIRNARAYRLATFGGTRFVTIPALKAPIGDIEIVANKGMPRFGAEPVYAAVDAFSMSLTEVSNNDFFAFITDEPYWSPTNLPTLINSNLADADYLRSWTDGVPPLRTGSLPVTEVSWYAAKAYAQWLSTQIFPSSKMRIRLPQEDEWEIAARINGVVENTSKLPAGIKTVTDADKGTIGLVGMNGNVREWCENPFRYSENKFRNADASSAYLSLEHPMATQQRPIRGGSYVDGKFIYPASARGFLNAKQSSPTVGFRVVISQN